MRSSTFAKSMSKAKKVEIAVKQPCAASRLFEARMLMRYSYYSYSTCLHLLGLGGRQPIFAPLFRNLSYKTDSVATNLGELHLMISVVFLHAVFISHPIAKVFSS